MRGRVIVIGTGIALLGLAPRRGWRGTCILERVLCSATSKAITHFLIIRRRRRFNLNIQGLW